MRYTRSSDHLILLYLVVTLASRFIECQLPCNQPDSFEEGKLIFKSDSYEYIIRVNQPSPTVNVKFEKFSTSRIFTPKFPFKFYCSNVGEFVTNTGGGIDIHRSALIGVIGHIVPGIASSEYEVSNGENLFAVRWSLQIPQNSSILTFKITTLLHSNGKISFYYDNIPKENGEKLTSHIDSFFWCDVEGVKSFRENVDTKWMKSGTLVEYEVSSDCPKHSSTKTCQNSTTCFWCERVNMCTTRGDENTHDFKVDGCRIQNVTTEVTEDTEQKKSRHSLHIIIPLVISFLVVCSCCAICLCLYRREK